MRLRVLRLRYAQDERLLSPFALSPSTPLRYAQDRLHPQGEVEA